MKSRSYRIRAPGGRLAAMTALAVAGGLLLLQSAGAGLIHHWTFDEASGNALDSVGGNTASLMGTTLPARTNGVDGSAMHFTGDNTDQQHLAFNSRITFTEVQPFTVAFWYKGTDAGDDDRYGAPILANAPADGTVSGNIQIYADTNSFINPPYGGARMQATNPTDDTFFVVANLNSASAAADPGPPTVVDDDVWHHLAFVSDGDTTPGMGDGTARVYVDGTLVDRGDYGDHSSGNYPSQRWDTLMTGSSFSTGNTSALGGSFTYFTQGSIDDLRVYNEALNAGAIRALLAPGMPAFTGAQLNDSNGLEFQSVNGAVYALEFAEPPETNFFFETGATLTGDGGLLTFFDPTGPSTSKVYRIVQTGP